MGLFSALGGIFGANKDRGEFRVHRRFEANYNDPGNIRLRAENAGFNPLLFVGPGVANYSGPGPGQFFGQAYANAGAALDEGLAALAATGRQVSSGQLDQGRSRAAQATRLAQQNEVMRQTLERISLRPKVPGIFGRGGGAGAAAAGVSAMPTVNDAMADYSNPFPVSGSSTRVGYGSHGETTYMPSASDFDEWLPATVIEGLNELKATGATRPQDMDGLQQLGRMIGLTGAAALTGMGRVPGIFANPRSFEVRLNPVIRDLLREVQFPKAIRVGGGSGNTSSFTRRKSGEFNPWLR